MLSEIWTADVSWEFASEWKEPEVHPMAVTDTSTMIAEMITEVEEAAVDVKGDALPFGWTSMVPPPEPSIESG